MNVTLTEALRIKNELSTTIKTLSYKVQISSFGVTVEDGEVTSRDEDKFNDVEKLLLNGLSFSEELNNRISDFNKEFGIDKLVRKMQNAKLLLSIYTNSLSKTKATTQKRFENLGTVRKSIEVVYTPSVTSTSMKTKISDEKSNIRDLQSKIEKLNQKVIAISFDYDDLESLTN